jgi:KDO2-lipid IV(A) lauroyltransferase
VSRASLAHSAQYLALRATVASLEALSWGRASRLGESLGLLGYRPLGIRRRVVEAHVRAAFPGIGDTEVRRISHGAYANLGRTSIETALLPSLDREGVVALADEVDGWEVVERALAKKKGLIFVAGHLGNWEFGAAYVAARGVPLDAIVRRMSNPRFDRYLNATRARLGMHVVHDAEAVRRTPRSLREGRAVGFLVDQGVVGLASTFVPFFGRPAKTPRGPAVFALRLDAPVVFGAAIRKPNGRFHVSFEQIQVNPTGDRDRDIDTIVTDYTAALERWVRTAPEQYFWHHRRWKRQPPGTPPDLAEPI